MSLNDDVKAIQKRIEALNKKSQELKVKAGIEERTIEELSTKLKENSIDVEKLSIQELEDKALKLKETLEKEKDNLDKILSTAEESIRKFEELYGPQ